MVATDLLRDDLRASFRWTDSGDADPSAWWLRPDLLARLVDALCTLHADADPSIVTATPARGFILGPLVAQRIGLGFVEIRKDRKGDRHGQALLRRSTPPDYADRDLTLTLRKGLLGARDRVLMIDDWIETGAQAVAARALVHDAGATWVGVATVVDATTAATRRDVNARSLLSVREL